MDPIWAPTSIEIKTLAQPTIFTVWLYNKALEREHKAKELIYKQELEKQKLLEKQLIEKQLMEKKLMLEKAAPMKAIFIKQSHKPKIETRINNDGSICKFLC
jgi:hypothetical protein